MRHPLHAVGAPSLGGLPQWLPNRFSRDMPRHGCYKECAMLSHHVKTFQAEIWVASLFVSHEITYQTYRTSLFGTHQTFPGTMKLREQPKKKHKHPPSILAQSGLNSPQLTLCKIDSRDASLEIWAMPMNLVGLVWSTCVWDYVRVGINSHKYMAWALFNHIQTKTWLQQWSVVHQLEANSSIALHPVFCMQEVFFEMIRMQLLLRVSTMIWHSDCGREENCHWKNGIFRTFDDRSDR